LYDHIPKKPGPKKKRREEPYSTRSVVLVEEVPAAIENFFLSWCIISPLFTLDQVETIKEYRGAVREKRNPVKVPPKEIMALFFALQGTYQRT
jgi:hypothetical protein